MQTVSALLRNRFRPRLCRRRLQNLPIGEVERPHLEEVAPSIPAPEARREVDRQPLDQRLAVPRPSASLLFLLDDTAADQPVRGGHERIDGPGRCVPGLLDHARDIAEQNSNRRSRSQQGTSSASWPSRASYLRVAFSDSVGIERGHPLPLAPIRPIASVRMSLVCARYSLSRRRLVEIAEELEAAFAFARQQVSGASPMRLTRWSARPTTEGACSAR